jgi:tRNA(adenine34) deaminase
MSQIITSENHIKFMQKALKEAQKAYKKDEVPIGAVVIDPQGNIIGRGRNLVEKTKLQISHAEIRAISQACRKIGDWRLEGCWIYVTLEPCALCMNLILLSRLKGVVFGASSPIFGFELDKNRPLQLYRRNMIEIIKGVCEEESVTLLKKFFKEKRKASERRGKKNF